MLSGLLGNLYGVAESFLELVSLGAVAGAVDGEALDFVGGLGVGSCCAAGYSDGCHFSVLEGRCDG